MEKFSLKIQPHMKFQIVAYEMRKKRLQNRKFCMYQAGYKLHFRLVLVFKPVWYVLAGSLKNWASVAKAAGHY